MRGARSYPFERLPRVERASLAALRGWARSSPLSALAHGGSRAAEWLGVALTVRPGTPTDAAPRPSREPSPSLLLEHRDGRAGLTLEPRLAALLVERTLGGEEVSAAAAGPATELEQGVLLYAIGRLLADTGWRVRDVFAYEPALREVLGEPVGCWPLELHVGEARAQATLWLPAGAAPGPVPRALPAWAEELPLAVIAQVGHATLGAAALAEVSPGDVVIPDAISVDAAGEGLAELELERSAWRARARVGRGAWEVESVGGSGPVAGEGRRLHVSEQERLQGLEDVPVTLRLELARFALRLSDVAALAPGEVLATGTPLGGPISLVAGDRVVARGELVDVDGEVGVRITDVTGAGP